MAVRADSVLATAGELAAEHDRHIEATSMQRQHEGGGAQ